MGLTAWALCAALHADPGLSQRTADRGCALAPAVLAAPGDPTILLAVALRESRFTPSAHRGRYCGAWQVSSHYGTSCADLQRPAIAARVAARLLAWFTRHRPHLDPLEAYAGCRSGCPEYVSAVRDRAARWRLHAERRFHADND